MSDRFEDTNCENRESTSSADRLPPHDEGAERAVLGSILIDPSVNIHEVILHLKNGSDVFFDHRHRLIFNTMLELFDDDVPIDTVTLYERLNIWGKSEQAGGVSYISTLADAVTSTQNLKTWMQIILGKYIVRNVLAFCTERAQAAFGVNGNSEQFLSQFEHDALAIRGSAESCASTVDVHSSISSLLVDYENAANNSAPVGIQTGFIDLDRLGGGMMEQELIILAGLRSTGKTTLALNIAYNVAMAGIGVGIISLETSGKKLIHRLACYSGEISGSDLMRGRNLDTNAPKVTAAFGRIISFQERLLICERADMSTTELGALCRRMHQRGARLFIIDYLQLLNTQGKSEYERITAASKFGKRLAKSLNAPVILLSALNRESEKGNKPRKPRLSDLRASGQIEYDADKAWLLYDPEFKEEFNNEESRHVALDFAKNKDGPTGTVNLTFFPKQFRMASAASVSDDYVPPHIYHEPQQQAGLPYADDSGTT
jgi:replicative DNA helicase